MKKQILVVLFVTLCLISFSQQVQEERAVINVEVPVRVFKDNKFIDNLTIDDFEIYEDGKLQKLEAIYLIKKKSVERREEKKRFAPQISRHFFLCFDLSEYLPRVGKAIDYFFDNVFFPGDNLVVITPMKTYNLKNIAMDVISKEEIANQLRGILRRDATIGNSEYRTVLKELRTIVKIIESRAEGEEQTSREVEDSSPDIYDANSLEEIVQMYSSVVSKLENLRKLDQQKLLNFAELLKNKEGQKHIFLFSQREFLPQIHPSIMNKFMTAYQDRPALLFSLSDFFQQYTRKVSIDLERVKQAFADSSLSVHFLFISKPAEHRSGLEIQERSDDIFPAFRQMAIATGGIVESSANPEFAFKKAVDAFKNYYLLYYSPKDYKSDGKFKKIEIRVKNRKFEITHRSGYFAN